MTKAETLKYLSIKLRKKINIPKFFFLSMQQLNGNYFLLYKNIKTKFKKKKIIIRSSSILEDTKSFSNAGMYDSVVLKEITFDNLKKAVIRIKKKFKSKKDQIIIQEFMEKPDISGVLFTRDINSNAPYYIINYDKSGKTNLVTSGKKNYSLKEEIFYKYKKITSKKFLKLIILVKKIENLLSNDRLDIEFAIKNNKVFIFQCRSLKKIKKFNKDKILDGALTNVGKKLVKLKDQQPNLIGRTTVLSNMSDWNPAEMIGAKSTPLSFSLYSELITNEIWSCQRHRYGYKNVSPHRLMINLAGSPYIDLRVDFNSFFPKNLPKEIQKKSIDFFINDIKKNPWKHDKIEFELIPTCYDFDLKENFKKFLNSKESLIYSQSLRLLTNNILDKKKSPFYKDLNKINLLEDKINEISKTKISSIQKIFHLIKICKEYGTLPFAGVARTAFISSKIIRSLVKLKILSFKELSSFYESHNTIVNQITEDLNKVNEKKISKKKFLSLYGHLRPSTYSISSLNYKEAFELYFSKSNKEIKKKKTVFKVNKNTLFKMNKILKKNQLSLSALDLFEIAKISTKKREESKFIFTKAINLIFENLINFSKEIEIPRTDLEFMSINTILNAYNDVSVQKLKKQIKKEIIDNKENYSISNMIKLPDVIISSKDVFNHCKILNFGNFITEKKTNGRTVLLNSKNINFNKNIIKDKIVLIENADPGYDFIFSHSIKGLVTKYGGANSHMAIRCLEFQLPAVIGVGEQKFDFLSKKNFIEIDCYKKLIN